MAFLRLGSQVCDGVRRLSRPTGATQHRLPLPGEGVRQGGPWSPSLKPRTDTDLQWGDYVQSHPPPLPQDSDGSPDLGL